MQHLLMRWQMCSDYRKAELPLGGGKAVILADPLTEKTPELLMAFVERVARLGGTFITGEDIGTTVADIEAILRAA